MDLWNDGTFLVFMTQHWDLQKQPSSLNFGVFVCFPTKVDKEMCPPGRSNPVHSMHCRDRLADLS